MVSPYCLIGDLGGTNVRFWLIKVTVEIGKRSYEVEISARYGSKQYRSLEAMIEKFFQDYGITRGSNQYPSTMVFCIAGPVENQKAHITNLGWDVSSASLKKTFGVPQCYIMNDFMGVGYGLLGLQTGQYVQLNPGVEPKPDAPMAVLGAGTGLGQAYLTKHAGCEYEVWPAEGGHGTFAPTNAVQFRLTEYIKRVEGVSRCSVERVASGSALKNVYAFLAEEYAPVANKQRVQKVLSSDDCAREINIAAQAAANGTAKGDEIDNIAVLTMKLFADAFSTEAGDLALRTLPFGGLYIAGGMAPKVRWAFENDNAFMKNFVAKGRLSDVVKHVPVYLVLVDEVGLIGCAVVAMRMVAAVSTLQKSQL